MFKQVYGTEFDVIKRTVAATSLLEGDEVITVFPVTDQKYVVLQTEFEVFLKFELDEVHSHLIFHLSWGEKHLIKVIQLS